MTFTRRATIAFAAATTSLMLLANTAMAESANKQKVRIFYDTFVTGNADLLDQVLAQDWANDPVNPGQGPGRDGFKKLIPGMSATFKNNKFVIEDMVEEGDKVVVRSTYSATQAGPFAGFPSKGRDFKIMTIDIHQFNSDGMVVKTWHLEDWLGGLFQMGAFEK
ncbi:MAG: ester cyclase [Rhizobiales bacterium]|nr:ester cyclase [Hyphomicrobiales bacterium]